jgi:uncharacterized protein YnzC (UPF0291/DUF896 family)
MNTQTINFKKSYLETQFENTEKQIQRLIDTGVEFIPLSEMDEKLLQIGLKLDLNENGYLNLYYNTSNENHYLEATTSPIDNKKISAYNVNGDFYNKHLKGNDIITTHEARELKKLRNDYFTTYKKRGKTYILSF